MIIMGKVHLSKMDEITLAVKQTCLVKRIQETQFTKLTRVGVIKIVIVINCNLITFFKMIDY